MSELFFLVAATNNATDNESLLWDTVVFRFKYHSAMDWRKSARHNIKNSRQYVIKPVGLALTQIKCKFMYDLSLSGIIIKLSRTILCRCGAIAFVRQQLWPKTKSLNVVRSMWCREKIDKRDTFYSISTMARIELTCTSKHR